jgi:hypothetical protein
MGVGSTIKNHGANHITNSVKLWEWNKKMIKSNKEITLDSGKDAQHPTD